MIKGVRKIVVLEQGTDGAFKSVSTYEDGPKKRKRSRWGKRPERNARRVYGALRAYVDELEKRHDKSARKRRDGWIADGVPNSLRAQRKAYKKLARIRFF